MRVRTPMTDDTDVADEEEDEYIVRAPGPSLADGPNTRL